MFLDSKRLFKSNLTFFHVWVTLFHITVIMIDISCLHFRQERCLFQLCTVQINFLFISCLHIQFVTCYTMLALPPSFFPSLTLFLICLSTCSMFSPSYIKSSVMSGHRNTFPQQQALIFLCLVCAFLGLPY